jgi:putative phosphoribosyl transferase
VAERLDAHPPTPIKDVAERPAAERPSGETNHPIVLALPRGGVAVGYEISAALGCSLDVIVARKLGAPFEPELAIGAIAPGGVCVVDEAAIEYHRIPPQQIERVAQIEVAEMQRRERLFRGDQPPANLADRTVILADDGLATGLTAMAAIDSIRLQSVKRLLLAVPVCAAETAPEIAKLVDDFVCLMMPERFRAVGLWYQDFTQVTDDEVVALLGLASVAYQAK